MSKKDWVWYGNFVINLGTESPQVVPMDWDTSLYRNGGHFLQSTTWQFVQQQLGYETAFVQGTGWKGLAVFLRRPASGYAYFPYGPVIDNGASIETMIAEMKEWGTQQHLAFLRIEPYATPRDLFLNKRGLVKTRDIQPEYTWITSLTSTEEELKKELRTRMRGYINSSERRGITFRYSSDAADIAIFNAQLEQTAHDRFDTHGKKYYETTLRSLETVGAGTLCIAECEGQPISCVLSFSSPTTQYYAHVSVNDAKNRELHASAPLVWKLMMDAKHEGKEFYDFWGVLPEEQPGHPWNGFTQFKKSFGGTLVASAGTWDIPTRRVAYRAARVIAKARR